jgi:transposase InsO family protein
VADNLLARAFAPSGPNQVRSADITDLWRDEGWLDLAIVPGLFNREVVGWSPTPRRTTDLVGDAPTMGWFRRKPPPGLIHHSDRGSQYASHAFQAKPAAYGMVCSMSRTGNCRDKAPTESGFNSVKNARVFGERFVTRDVMKATAFADIEVFYNRKRLHSTLGDPSPALFLKDWINTREGEKQVA